MQNGSGASADVKPSAPLCEDLLRKRASSPRSGDELASGGEVSCSISERLYSDALLRGLAAI